MVLLLTLILGAASAYVQGILPKLGLITDYPQVVGLPPGSVTPNRQGILDGSVAVVAYPDMVTQLPYPLDCELLEYYFDHLASDKVFWRNPDNRQAVMGLSNNYHKSPMLAGLHRFAQAIKLNWPQQQAPGSECNAGWRGSVAMVNISYRHAWILPLTTPLPSR